MLLFTLRDFGELCAIHIVVLNMEEHCSQTDKVHAHMILTEPAQVECGHHAVDAFSLIIVEHQC